MSRSRVNRALVLAIIVLLAGHTAPMAAVASERLVQGKIYYITLLKHPGCPNLVQYLGFNTKECASHNTITLKPLSKPTAAVWARWTLGVQEERPDGSYVVQIINYWDPNSDISGPKCLGKLNVVKPSLCNVGRDVSKVDIRVSSTQKWMLRPVGSKTYQIVSLTRRSGCMRYLGGTGPCGALRPALFKRDSGSGLQRWTVKEVPSQQASLAAGEPTVTSSVATVTAWQVKWQDGTIGSPEESYALKCTAADATSCFAPPVGPVADNIPRGTETGILTGLPADTDLLCYVVALNGAGLVCSTAQVVQTLPAGPVTSPPGAPAIIASSVKGGVWSVAWQDGEAGKPEETLSAFCVDYGAACTAVATGNSVYGVKRGVQTTEVTGLPSGRYSCYVQAQNAAGTACSTPAIIEVTLRTAPGTPTDLRGVVSGQSWAATWKDGARGVPEETYVTYCGPRGGGCSVGQRLGTSETVARGVQHGTAKDLPPWTALDCWVVAVNAEGRACAGPMAVEVAPAPPANRAPGAPIQPQTADITSDSWTVTWVDGIAGVPEETYSLACVSPGQSCSASPLVSYYGLPRGIRRATLKNLSPRTFYTCYVIARNSVGRACSTGLSVSTPGTGVYKPGKPTHVSETVSGTTWVATWTDGYVGAPLETYTAKCVALGAPCDFRFSQGATQTNIPRGTEIAYVSELPVGTFSCYIVASNSAGDICSDPAVVIVSGAARPPGQPSAVSGTIQVTTWAARWTDGAVGNPQETYIVKCVAQGAGCTATAVGQAATGIPRGVQAGSTGPLPVGASYSCYVIATNVVLSICSNPVTVTPGGLLSKPGTPTVTGVSRTATAVTLWWTVGTKGNPEEKYAVECHIWPATCSATPLGAPADGIARAAGTATTTGLPNTRLACYVIAHNTNFVVDNVCSLVVDVPPLT